MSALEDEDKGRFGRVYGRGFFDGLKRAGIANPDEFMNANKLQEMEESLTGIAKKILQSVPIANAWTLKEIHADLLRKKMNIERHAMDGCMSVLKDRGLVREPEPGKFIRVSSVKPIIRTVAATPPPLTTSAPVSVVEVDPLSELAECASQARALAAATSALATRIEEAAVGAEEKAQRIHAESAKMRQLQDLLKSMT